MPKSPIYDFLFSNDSKTVMHLEKINPLKPWGNFKLIAQASLKVDKSAIAASSVIYNSGEPSKLYF